VISAEAGLDRWRRVPRPAVVFLLRLTIALAAYIGAAAAYRYALGSSGRRPGVVPVVAATAIVALVLRLLDERLGRLADVLVFGSRARDQREVRGLAQRMASTLPVDEVVPRLAEAAGRTLGGPRAEVRLTLADGHQLVQVWPVTADAAGSSMTVDVRHHGASIGEIEAGLDAGASGRSERRLLDQLAAPAGLALSTVRLTFELRQRIAELDHVNAALLASKERLLTARRDEQRRLEREVDVRVMRHVGTVENALTALADRYQPRRLDQARQSCEQALDELRVIARGIFPPRLADAGVIVSIEGWLDRAGIPGDVTAGSDLDRLHQHQDLETCLYFCGIMTLAALASNGYSELLVQVAESPNEVSLRVSGRGGGRPPDDDALAVVRDRIEAFDGAFELLAQSYPAGTYVMSCRAPLPTIPISGTEPGHPYDAVGLRSAS
jgi:hypothetical protein